MSLLGKVTLGSHLLLLLVCTGLEHTAQNRGRPRGRRCTVPFPGRVRALAFRLWGEQFSLGRLVPHPRCARLHRLLPSTCSH